MWWFKRKTVVEQVATPSEQRQIFEYWDGRTTRKIDPLLAWHGLFADPEIDIISELEKAAQGQMDAHERVSEITRKVFGVCEYDGHDGEGLTRLELHKLIQQFFMYVDAQKKTFGPMPLPLHFLVRKRSSAKKESTTPRSAGSCSTADESKSSEPCPCSTPSVEPSPVS